MLAQEEFAKAFVLALVRDGLLPWTEEVRRSLRVHECKHLVTIIMEWLLAVNELRSSQSLDELYGEMSPCIATGCGDSDEYYRHEMIERIGGRNPEHYAEWGGAARKAAKGKRDRKKQAALYVDIRNDGGVASEPTMSTQEFETEFAHAKKLIEFAG